MNPQVWWFLSRASGIVAWLMLTTSVLCGVLLATKAFPRTRQPQWLLAMHRWLAGLTFAFLAVHLAALVADSYVEFDLADVTIPYASAWRPGAVALGVVAAWMLLAVALTSLAMRRLPRRVWRIVHFSSYFAFWFTSLHAAFAGSDAGNGIQRAGGGVVLLAVAWALMYRLANRRSARRLASARVAPVRRAAPGR